MRLLRPVVSFVVLGLAPLAGALGCGAGPQPMTTSAIVPAAEGTVQPRAADNGATGFTVRVRHLAPPSRVAPEATVYMVWVQPADGQLFQSVGAMTVDKDLIGSFDAVTRFDHFTVIVTPEANDRVEQPTHEPVFTSQVSRP
jgi:hypothetical protein